MTDRIFYPDEITALALERQRLAAERTVALMELQRIKNWFLDHNMPYPVESIEVIDPENNTEARQEAGE